MVEHCVKSVIENMELKTIKSQVEHCLISYKDARNSDILLRQQIIRIFYPEKIKNLNGYEAILFRDEYDVPTQEAVKRVRAKFNSEGSYWPTDLKVAIGRGILENEWRMKLGYPRVEETKQPTKEESYTSKVLEQKLL